jgi:nicotinamide mononucleotide transporter
MPYYRAMAHWLEILGLVTGIACVLFGIAENPWNWPVGLGFNVVLFIVFWRNGIYALAVLQLVYIVIGLYGWWNWLHGGADHGALTVSRTSPPIAMVLIVLSTAAVFSIHAILARYTPSTLPWMDAITTSLLLSAQYLLSRKLMATWIVFSIADLVAIVINIEKRLYPLAALYFFFLMLCAFGFKHWHKSMNKVTA